MKIRIYQIDAFADNVFSGNPAAVCPLDNWLSDDLMQKIAAENNLAETAFYVRKNDRFEIRWFTPAVEVDLCGHATLAAAYVLFNHEGYSDAMVKFISPRSGELTVTRNGQSLTMNFPTDEITEVSITTDMEACFDIVPTAVFKGKTDFLFLYEDEDMVKNMKPNFNEIAKLDSRGIIITSKGNEADFVSRFFGPRVGIMEDPVTGSAHTTLTPYWAHRLDKTTLTAVQLSPRKGFLECTYLDDRVEISGQGKLYLTGEIYID